ncbi:phosphatidate cytidylyltransferase, partial [Vibrio sp. Vb0592]|uniref:phosphatidate cytidylyltransferase n=1 Tax=Vibrio sp. Vb0592 TaxID=2816072 RepID=UPI001A8DF18F
YFLLLRYHPHDDTLGIWTLTLPLLATFATDIGAYFIGRYFGRNKLAPTTSPGKTVEGSIGGIASSFVVLLIYTSIVRHFYPESAFALL